MLHILDSSIDFRVFELSEKVRPIGCVFGDETIGLTLFAAAPIVATNS